jgi:hypothetical protein
MRWKNLLFNITLAINCLLCFLLLFESRLVVPAWLQVAGRMHPLILHFPIALVVLFVFQRLVLRLADNTLLLLAAFTAAATALMGLFLSKEPGYDPDVLFWHKYSGIAVSFLTLAWYHWFDRLSLVRYAGVGVAIGCLALLTFTGDKGADITHGRNFLLAPVSTASSVGKVALEDAVVFNDMVRPILQNKCMGCHNSSKAKGQLIMETTQLLLKGGKNGPVWDSSDAGLGLMMRRIHLPLDDEKHMPVKGKPQLTDQEITILYQWLKHDPTRSVRVAQLPSNDTLYQLAAALFRNGQDEDQYDFPSADEKLVHQLNTSYRVVSPVALNSPGLNVDFFSPQFFQPGQLKDLDPIARQIVSLDLDKMPVTDADIPTIVRFSNLRTLNLSFTGVTGAGITQLCRLGQLKSLSLSGTPVKSADIACLLTMKSLRRLYLWNTAIAPGTIASAGKGNGGLDVETGIRTDTMLIRLNPPILQNDERILLQPVPLRLKHYVPGVAMRYTLDGSSPDSNSTLYRGAMPFSENAVLKVRAFKKGWLPSDSVETRFYTERYRPDSVIMLRPLDSNYKGRGPRTVIDLDKGDLNWASGKWLGFRRNDMQCLLLFDKPVEAHTVTLSSMINTGASILPPAGIEIWGGSSAQSLRLLGRLTPDTARPSTPPGLPGYDIAFRPTLVRCIKVVLKPVGKLPDWQIEKGKPGWAFVDEIFVN